ncbi:MAG: SulP family inorganic anion transporter [Bacteriovoracaceae bacterium]
MNMFKTWRSDAQSSLVVFLVALPLCLGIALASNAPLASGLFAGIIGGIVVGFLSGSHISVSGPAAGLTVIVVNSIAELGAFEAFSVAVFVSGLIQILFGVFKGGVIGNYFPNSVIKGMLAAIGIILILKQFPHAVGYDTEFMGSESFLQSDGENTFSGFFKSFNALHWGAIVISSFSIFLMIGWEKLAGKGYKFFKLFPGALAAVFLCCRIQ